MLLQMSACRAISERCCAACALSRRSSFLGRRYKASRSNANTSRSMPWEMLGKGHEEVVHEVSAFAQYRITHTTHMLREATEPGT